MIRVFQHVIELVWIKVFSHQWCTQDFFLGRDQGKSFIFLILKKRINTFYYLYIHY